MGLFVIICYMSAVYNKSKVVTIGGRNNIRKIHIGGDNPITIQTMWKEEITDIKSNPTKLSNILNQIENLSSLGCDIIRFAVPDMQSAEALSIIASNTTVPLVADIHFDWRLAIECSKGPISVIRINPGNIGSKERVEAVVNACKDNGIAIRIGVNTGSLPKDLEMQVENKELSRAQALAKTALRELAVFDELDFHNVVVSMKASSVEETIEANRAFASVSNIPLHIGVTEAGPLITGIVKSTLAFSTLLKDGIGSTIRVSLSSSPENEVIAGREILHECGLRSSGVTLISCPRCGREGFDVHSFMDRWQNELLSLKKNVTIAVMGCIVNGPGEGKHADLGIAGGKDKVIIFKKGKIIRTIETKDADKVFREELESL